jgi:hypothetical protein
MNLQENISRIKEVILLNEQLKKDPLQPPSNVLVDDDERYSGIGVKDDKIVGLNSSNRKWEIIPNNYPKYSSFMKMIQDANKLEQSNNEVDNGPVVDLFDSVDKEPIKVNLGKLTKEDINKIYKYSVEFNNGYNELRKKGSKDSFCDTDMYDISAYPADAERIKKCGVPSFENVIPGKLLKPGQFVKTIMFMVLNPNHPRVAQNKKTLGITQ